MDLNVEEHLAGLVGRSSLLNGAPNDQALCLLLLHRIPNSVPSDQE